MTEIEKILDLIELDVAFYRQANPWLLRFSNEQYGRHYSRYGYTQGRPCHALCTREAATGHIKGKRVLEIGPFCFPSLQGPLVKYFDVLDKEQIIDRATSHNLNPEAAPDIDFVSPVGDLGVIDEKFESVFSAHVIEHQPDLVSHLKKVSRLLDAGGQYVMVIPDRRFCFDAEIPASTFADVLLAHEEKHVFHTIKSLVNHRAFVTHNDTAQHWTRNRKKISGIAKLPIAQMQAALAEYRQSGNTYLDAHAWQFEPLSFAQIVRGLLQMQLIEFSRLRCFGPVRDRNEFVAILVK